MKKELQEEKKREKSAWDQKTAKAAADADLIKAELAREEGKDAFKEQSVQMRLAVEKVKEQQAEAIREAEAVAQDAGVDPQGLGDSADSLKLTPEEQREEEDEVAMEKEVELAHEKQRSMEIQAETEAKKAGLSLGDSSDIKVDKAKFSLKSLEKGNAEAKAAEKKAANEAKQKVAKMKAVVDKEAKKNGGSLSSQTKVLPNTT